MHARTLELLRHLDASRSKLREAYEATASDLREARPAPDRWSVANILSHLARIESQVSALLKRKLRRTLADQPLPQDPSTDSVLTSVDRDLLLDRARKIEAPEVATPDPTQSAAEAWQQLEQARRTSREVLLAADGLQTDSIRSPHPLLGELHFHQWFAFLGYHEQRHAMQIEALRAEQQS